ncbi:MAG TPA: flavin reductase family protein [Solirubrobacteraceae bacterium]|nr:flavin reductase family protein [Solirubrobacteraceae bacterium]
MSRISLAPASVDAADADASAPAPFETDAFRRTLGRFATGVTLVTAADSTGPLGLIVNAFTSVSLEPPLIAVCPSRHSFTWTRMRRCKRFGVNVLGAEHRDYVRHAAHADAERFVGIDYELVESGVPRIRSAIAFLDCEPVSEQRAGDHWIVVARVHAVLADRRREPLVFSDGTLGSFAALETSRITDPR